MPIVPQAIPYLAESKQLRGAPNPSLLGRIFSLGILTLSNTNSPVAEALKLHFPCVSGVEKLSFLFQPKHL